MLSTAMEYGLGQKLPWDKVRLEGEYGQVLSPVVL